MKCCATCIGDKGLARTLPSRTQEVGTCDYCLTTETLVVEPKVLAELFYPLVGIYEPDDSGKLLVQWLREDWGMFEHERMDDSRAKDLLGEILDDGELVRRSFAPSPSYVTDSLRRWEELRTELMFGNRYFPETEIKRERLTELLELLEVRDDDLPLRWHRARLMVDEQPYAIEAMGAPPKRLATHGRANPAGIPYLYLGSTPKTAVAEIRPHTGDTACIAEFSIGKGLRIVDLRSPKHSVSALDFGDETKIGYLRGDLEFLSRLGDELTRPVAPKSAAIDYVPSQYLCEFIKKCEYDGVIYRSSVGDGMNLALFAEQKATPGNLAVKSVLKVSVDIDP